MKLRAEGRRGQSSSPDRVKNFLFSTSSRPLLMPTLQVRGFATGWEPAQVEKSYSQALMIELPEVEGGTG
jgi:hypothetical protein